MKAKMLASLLAAAVSVSALSSMTAFADTTITNSNAQKSASLPLAVTGSLTQDNTYQAEAVWCVEVILRDGDLSWGLSGTKTDTYSLTWDPTTCTYNTPEYVSSDTNSLTGQAAKYVYLENHSNFAVDTDVAIMNSDMQSESTDFIWNASCMDNSNYYWGYSYPYDPNTGEATYNHNVAVMLPYTDCPAYNGTITSFTSDNDYLRQYVWETGIEFFPAEGVTEASANAVFTFHRASQYITNYGNESVTEITPDSENP
jgi:hypothetical protein